MSLCWLSPYDTWQNVGLYLYLTWSGFVSCVWALRSSPCFSVWPEAKRSLSGGRWLSRTSDALTHLAAAAVSVVQILHFVGVPVFSCSLATDCGVLVSGVHFHVVCETVDVRVALGVV